MKYISTIKLENFQSHKDTVIEFSKGLNVIVGPSDSGKTSIIRAILWVLLDHPQGDGIIRAGEQYASVKIEMSDGSFVKKTRKGKKSAIKIFDSKSGNEETYAGSKGDVKEKISKIFGIPLDESGKLSYNIHDQLSPPFLLNESSSEKAKAIGKLVGVDMIDEATSDTNSDILAKTKDINKTEKEIESIKFKLGEFSNLEDERRELEEKSKLLELIDEKLLLCETLEQNLRNTKSVQDEISKTKHSIQKLDETLKTAPILEELSGKIINFNKERLICKRLYDISASKENSLKIISQTDKIEKSEEVYINLSIKVETYSKLLPLSIKMKENLEELSDIKIAISENKYSKSREKILTVVSDKLLQYERLFKIGAERIKNQSELKKVSYEMESYKKLPEAEGIFEKLPEKFDKYSFLNERLNSRKKLAQRISDGREYVKEREREVKEKVSYYADMLKGAKVCPTCLRPVNEHEIRCIMEEYEV